MGELDLEVQLQPEGELLAPIDFTEKSRPTLFASEKFNPEESAKVPCTLMLSHLPCTRLKTSNKKTKRKFTNWQAHGSKKERP